MIRTIFLIVALSCGALYALADALAIPYVHVSYETKKCVAVFDENGEHKCPKELPAKYHRVWVE